MSNKQLIFPLPETISIRDKLINKVENIFKNYNGVKIDTPTIIPYTIIEKFYGNETQKQVFKIHPRHQEIPDQILRFDLTGTGALQAVRTGFQNSRRYQIGSVFRDELNPQPRRGRFTKFYQADFDIINKLQVSVKAKTVNNMVEEIELITMLDEILTDLVGTKFTIQINSKRLLYTVLKISDVPENLLSNVCSTIDKIDKKLLTDCEEDIKLFKKHSYNKINTEDTIQKELLSKKIDPTVINKLLDMLRKILMLENLTFNSFTELFKLENEPYLGELEIFFKFFETNKRIVFNPLLARGLDYYTGLIYEAKYFNSTCRNIGSIGSGGRYDGMLNKIATCKNKITSIGISIGIDRIVTLIQKDKELRKKYSIGINKYQVFVSSIGKNMVYEKLQIWLSLVKQGIKAFMFKTSNPKMGKQLNFCFENKIPYMVIIGDNEVQKGVIQIKEIKEKNENFKAVQIEMEREVGIKFLVDKYSSSII